MELRSRRTPASAIVLKQTNNKTEEQSVILDLMPSLSIQSSKEKAIKQLPVDIRVSHTKLSRTDHALLLRKQAWLKQYQLIIPRHFAKHRHSVGSTLVFAQGEAGTAVCISDDGLILTCSHCIAESRDEFDMDQRHWLLFQSGRVVSARCTAWDDRRDLALLQIFAAQEMPSGTVFESARVDTHDAVVGSKIICVGHPGSEDLEASIPGIKTNYDVLHVSSGVYHGVQPGQDVQDNSEIGALMHDAWTYWGHSGAPLFSVKSGCIIGLHSSWDDETGMRRGIALAAIQQFLSEHKAGVASELPSIS